MTEQELREKIAQELYSIMGWRQVWGNLGDHHQDYWRIKADKILALIKALIKEAGYVLPNSNGIVFDGVIDTLKLNEMLHQWAKTQGYVRLAEDQNLPPHIVIVTPERWNIPSDVEVHMDGDEGQGWRKVMLND